jgi:hypothetical protein
MEEKMTTDATAFEMTPYTAAFKWIQQHPFTGSSESLAKLVLSLWNAEECAFSYRECVRNLDSSLSKLASSIIEHFNQVGEDQELVKIGYEIVQTYHYLWEIGEAQYKARLELDRKNAEVYEQEPEQEPSCNGPA